jgi:nitroimidazol reductase NimA-like FMN-containing flavoprotein (pyridoxamine 5'-phosphate oxidase superfamily)
MGVIRDLPADRIDDLLRTAIVGRIACGGHGGGEDARPYLVPIAFGYDGKSVFAHSGPGRKLRLMRENPLVTFEVDRAEAADHWESVIIEGLFEEIPDGPERDEALRAIYKPPKQLPDLGIFTVVYRIRAVTRTGRYERPA